MVDFFLLLQLPGAGDELQGIKKGIMEMADAVLINKADGDNRLRAEQARVELDAALHYIQSATTGWTTASALCSAQTGEGVPEIWDRIELFYRGLTPKGVIAARRNEQTLDWLADFLREELRQRFYADPRVQERLPELHRALLRGELTVVRAANQLLALHDSQAKTALNI
jgi:LAO/AO transport system kinase